MKSNQSIDNEEWYRILYEENPSMHLVLNAEGKILSINNFGAERLNYVSGELAGQSVLDIVHQDDTTVILAQIAACLHDIGQISTRELRMVHNDGTILWVKDSVRAAQVSGKDIVILVVCEDITEYRRVEGALRESDMRYRSLAESARDVIFTLSPDGKITSLNPAFETITGWLRTQWIGKSFEPLIHPDELPVPVEIYQHIFNGKMPSASFEFRILSKSGDYITMDFTITPQAQDRKVVGYLGIARDITGYKRSEEALKQSEEKYRTLVDSIQDGIFIIQDAKILFANEAFARMGGYTADEVIGRDFQEFVAPEDLEMVIDRYYRRQAGEDVPREYEIHALRRDGTRITVNMTVGLIHHRGRVASMGIVKDITEHKRAEKALQGSEEKYRTMIEHSNDIIWTLDKQGNFTYFNKRTQEISGYQLEELQGKSYEPLIAPDKLPEIRQIFSQTLSGESRHYDVDVLKKDGSILSLSVNTAPIFESGEIVGTVSFGRDVTEHRRAAEQILEQAALLDKAHDAIIVRDMEQRITYWNKGAQNLYGWQAEEVIGKNVNELLHRDDEQSRLIELQKKVTETGEWSGELRQRTKEGKELIVENRWTLVRDNRGEPKSILLINTDITEKKMLEEQFSRAERLESIGRLAGGIAHDLNNILMPIMLSMQLLQEKVTDEESLRLLNMLERNARRGTHLIKQVLSFERGIESERQIVQPADLISEIEKTVKETFPGSIEVAISVDKNLWNIAADAIQLYQVLMNICLNARDAMPDGGTLSISAENLLVDENFAQVNAEARAGPYIVITVSDTGTGIPPEIIDRIFEPFFTTKEPGRGTGIGLSTALGIVKSHGGFIEVHSETGKGTVFKVYLPAIKAETVDAPAEEHRKLILVVDDDAQICEITRKTLETYGYSVLVARDGTEAISLYSQNRDEIKAVLMDIRMPVMNGRACSWVLRKIDPNVKIIALERPFIPEKLLETIHEVLNP